MDIILIQIHGIYFGNTQTSEDDNKLNEFSFAK